MPLLLLETARIVPGESRAIAMAVVGAGVYFGQFISPVVLKWAGGLIGPGDVFRQQFNVLALGLSAATLIAIIVGIRNAQRGMNPPSGVKIPGH